MEMYFVTKVTFNNLLFKGLNISNTGELVGACIVIFVMTVIFESLKMLKIYLSYRLNENPLAGVQNLQRQENTENAANTQDEIVLLSSLRFPVSLRQIRARKIVFHILSTLSHMVNFFYGYLLMLLVMTYSAWFTIAVIVGSGVGFFIFGAISQSLQLHLKHNQTSHMSTPGDDHHQLPGGENVQACAGHL